MSYITYPFTVESPTGLFQQFSSRPSERRQVALCVFSFISLEYSPFCFIDTFLVFSYGTVTLPVSRVTENLNILLAMLFSTFCTSLMVWVARILDEPTLCPLSDLFVSSLLTYLVFVSLLVLWSLYRRVLISQDRGLGSEYPKMIA